MLKFEGKELTLVGEAFFGQPEERYKDTIVVLRHPIKQHAIDEEESYYTVIWANEHPDAENIEDMCDWDKPIDIIKQ